MIRYLLKSKYDWTIKLLVTLNGNMEYNILKQFCVLHNYKYEYTIMSINILSSVKGMSTIL